MSLLFNTYLSFLYSLCLWAIKHNVYISHCLECTVKPSFDLGYNGIFKNMFLMEFFPSKSYLFKRATIPAQGLFLSPVFQIKGEEGYPLYSDNAMNKFVLGLTEFCLAQSSFYLIGKNIACFYLSSDNFSIHL